MKKAKILEHLEAVAPIFPAPIYWFDLNSRFLGINQLSLEAIGGKNYEDVVGRTPYEIGYYGADKIVEHNNKVIKLGRTLSQEDVISNISTGKIRTFLAVRSPIFDEEGKIIGVVGTSVETTAEKEAEILRQENEKLALQAKAQQKIAEEQNRFKDLVAQVNHDIRSPLASLQMLTKQCANLLPEEERNAYNKAITRIMDIANNMMNYFKAKAQSRPIGISNREQYPLLAATEILEVLTEKRYEYSQLPLDFTYHFSQEGYFAFIKANGGALKRAISNLINNAVEACDYSGDKGGGCVAINLDVAKGNVRIIVQDNGGGMSLEVKDKILNNISITSGKEGGHGIGFGQIRETVAGSNGKLTIDSNVGKGTKIILEFPQITSPAWIAESIELHKDDLIVILDDDPSIHGAWKSRFATDAPELKLKHFEIGQEAIDFINSKAAEEKKKIFLLSDFELLDQKVHGLQVIEQTAISRSILVTSHYNNREVRELAARINTKILPKLLAVEIPIKVNETLIERHTDFTPIDLKEIDMVMIDDDEMLLESIARVLFAGKRIDTYNDPQVFLANMHLYSQGTKMLIDNNFKGHTITGIEIANRLYENGFEKLYLFSGTNFYNDNSLPSYLTPILKTDMDALMESMK